MTTLWLVRRGDQTTAPMTTAQLKQCAANGKVKPSDKIAKAGTERWQRADTVKGLELLIPEPSKGELVTKEPPPVPSPVSPPEPQYAPPQQAPPPQQPMLNQQIVINSEGSERRVTINPAMAALMSLFIPGLGQLAQGRIAASILFFWAAVFIYVVSFFLLFIPGLMFHLFVVAEAAMYKP